MPSSFRAPIGKFLVVGVDTFSSEDWVNGVYDTKEEAMHVAKEKGGAMTMYYVYDDNGKCVGEAGSF